MNKQINTKMAVIKNKKISIIKYKNKTIGMIYCHFEVGGKENYNK